MIDDDADAHRIRARAEETLARLNRPLTFEEMVENETRREINRRAAIDQRIDRIIAESKAKREIEQPAEKVRWMRNAADITMDRAEELCRKAWAAPYTRQGCGGQASVIGNCLDKSLWLQARLGGVVFSGWRAGGGHHAALLIAIDGDLYVADHGEVVAVGSYPFHFAGFYERA